MIENDALDWYRQVLGEQGLEFTVVIENDFKKILFEDALYDDNVVFDERSFKYFRKSKS